MLFAGKTKAGDRLWPYWWCFLFGGNYRQKVGGYAWTPGVYRRTVRYYKENWKEAGYSWAEFVGLRQDRREGLMMHDDGGRKPTIAELEAILNSGEDMKVVINPDGSVKAVREKEPKFADGFWRWVCPEPGRADGRTYELPSDVFDLLQSDQKFPWLFLSRDEAIAAKEKAERLL